MNRGRDASIRSADRDRPGGARPLSAVGGVDYLKEHPGGAEVKTLVDHLNREILFYADASAEPPSLRPLQLSFALIADYDAEQLEEILDSHRA